MGRVRKKLIKKDDIASLLLTEVSNIYPFPTTELANWSTPFQFLICIILSAQTTDRQVNKTTEVLFRRYPDAKSLSKASIGDIYNTLRGINYYRTKSRHILEVAKILYSEYSGQPPLTLKELLTLPGVGYKTANVFLNDLYRSNQGIAVDTHVARVARAYGLTKEKDPTKISYDLEKLYKKEDWYKVNSTFVMYGRYILKARNPDWSRVVLKEYIVRNF